MWVCADFLVERRGFEPGTLTQASAIDPSATNDPPLQLAHPVFTQRGRTVGLGEAWANCVDEAVLSDTKQIDISAYV
jgi:hypothetical protein